MKLPSLQSLWTGLQKVITRFPLQIVVAISATIFWWLLIDTNYKDTFYQYTLWKLLYTCNFALTLLLAGDLFAEMRGLSLTKKWCLRSIILLISVGLYFLLNPMTYHSDLFRVFLLALAFHLAVAFAPFIGRGNINGFWQYNKSLFLRILTAGLYSGVLFAGLSIALVAVDGLFNVKIDYKVYLHLLSFIGSCFTTIFFLAGVPENFKELDEEESYPRGLKIFTQYVLIPLMTIYLAILLVYEVKIAIEWHLPKGLVSTLILGYSVFGILSLLLIYPIRNKEGNGWIRLFSKFFYLMMIPLILLLILAIIKRVGAYGITESRYILMALAVWLTAITIYFLTSKKQNIKVIPISLTIFAVLVSYGPQSAFSVSKFSQQARLAKLMNSKKKKDTESQSSIIRYLVQNHGLTSLQQFTSVNLDSLQDRMDAKSEKIKDNRWKINEDKIDTAFAVLKIKDNRANYKNSWSWITFQTGQTDLIDVKGYDAIIDIENYFAEKEVNFNGDKIIIKRERADSNKETNATIIVTVNNQQVVFDFTKANEKLWQEKDAQKLKETSNNTFIVPDNLMEVSKITDKYEIKFIISTLSTDTHEEEKHRISTVEGHILIKKR
ncbi:DUF4153 domain-containing protein [Pedobacter sp. MW01-1-1]|uniref:DUF4153 domain-containing protein n=1 Tax=Pedobacter sp. MW01-1-1 TaxID=3383027 RepID=UPI003FF064FC